MRKAGRVLNKPYASLRPNSRSVFASCSRCTLIHSCEPCLCSFDLIVRRENPSFIADYFWVFPDSKTTISNVQIGPKNNDPSHQPKPLLPFACARPALINDRVNQPTAYSPGLFILLEIQKVFCSCFSPFATLNVSLCRTALISARFAVYWGSGVVDTV